MNKDFNPFAMNDRKADEILKQFANWKDLTRATNVSDDTMYSNSITLDEATEICETLERLGLITIRAFIKNAPPRVMVLPSLSQFFEAGGFDSEDYL